MICQLLTELALSLIFWPATFHCMDLDPPVACAEPTPSHTVCFCTPEGTCVPVGVDFNVPVAAWQLSLAPLPPQAPACTYRQGCCPGKTTPVDNASWTVPANGPKTYEVHLRLNGEGLGCEEAGCTCPKVAIVEGGHALVSVNGVDRTGKPAYRMIHVHLAKAEGDCVNMKLAVTPPYPSGKPGEKFHVEQTVHLDTVTGLVLSSTTPEPCCAEVVVSPMKTRVATPPQVACTPVPAAPMCYPAMPVANTWQRCGSVAQPTPPVCPQAPVPPPAPRYIHTARPFPMPAPAQMQPPAPLPMYTYRPEPIPEPMPMVPPPVNFASFPMPIYPPVMGWIESPKSPFDRHGLHIHVVRDSGKSKLKVQAKDGTSSTAVRMKLEASEVGCLRLAASKTYVHVTGKMWKATADHVELHDDGRIVLTGHVKVYSDKVGVCSSLKAERVSMRVKHGKVEKISGGVFSGH